MDILATFKAKVQELGDVAVGEALGIPKQFIKGYVEEKKTFGLKTCQKIIDLWPATEVPAVDMPNPLAGDGAISNVWDEDGIINGSYCPPEWGQKKKAWNGRDVCLCLPVYNDVPQAHYFTMLATVAKYRQGLRIEFRGEDSMITRSRNHLAKRFLRDTDATWSVWFDSDMVFPRGDAKGYATMTNMRGVPEKFLSLHTIERLISHQGRTVVGGCYWDRRGSGKLIAGGGGALMKPIPSDALHAIGFVGTGCLAVHRQVFLDIAAKFPETYSEKSIGNECGFFTNIQTPERMLGEDESFAKRATDAGHPSFLDLGILCGHVGQSNIHALPQHGSRI